MKPKRILIRAVVATVALCLCHAEANAYSDHRTPKVDSLENALKTKSPKGDDLLRIYVGLMWGYKQSDPARSMEMAQLGAAHAEKHNKLNAMHDCYRLIGMHLYNVTEYDSAMVWYNKALEATDRMKGDKRYTEEEIDDNYSNLYGTIGNLYNMQGKVHQAIEYYTRAMKIFEKYGWKESMVFVHKNIGELYLEMGNYGQAEANYRKSLDYALQTDDSMMVASARDGLAIICLNNGNYREAEEHATYCYQYNSSHSDREAGCCVTSLTMLARVHLLGYADDRKAEEYILKALAGADTLDYPTDKADAQSVYAEIFLHREQWRKAEQMALLSLKTSDADPHHNIAVYNILVRAYLNSGRPLEALGYFERSIKQQNEYANEHFQSALTEMEVLYETEKKEARIASLEEERQLIMWLSIAGSAALLLLLVLLFIFWRWTAQKKRIAEQQVAQLEQERQLIATQSVLDGETAERTRLARDLHDGLGSMLTGVKLNLETMKNGASLKKIDMEHFSAALGMLNESMLELRRVAHHLMPDSLSRYGLKVALSDFCGNLPQVSFDYFGSEERLDPKMEVMIYRIVHELVNNALKHADASQVMVQVMRESNYAALIVRDDGKGFDPSLRTAGMGLRNIRDRVATYNGRIEISSGPGRGTEVNIEFSI